MMIGIVLAALSPEALGCAGLVHSETSLAESDSADVLFEVSEGEIAVSYAVQYEGDAADLGWVIPVPGAVAAVEDGDLLLFDSLREASQPLVLTESDSYSGSGGCACGGGALKGSDNGSSEGELTFVGAGFTGTYEYVLIEAQSAADLQTWFDSNGWSGLPAEDIAHYVDAGATFAALRVLPGAGEGEQRSLPPIRVRYDGEISFPAVMARHAAVQSQRTTIYVLGETRAALTGTWSHRDPEAISGGLDDDALSLWEASLASLGEQHGYSRSFAGTYDTSFLTRFDTLAPATVHDADVEIALEASTDGLSTTITLSESGGGRAAVPAALALLIIAGLRRKDR